MIITLLLCLLLASSAGASEFPIGLHRSNLAWHEEGDTKEAELLIGRMTASGAALVRLSVNHRNDFSKVAKHIRYCEAEGMDTILQIAITNDDFLYPAGLEKRPGYKGLWPSYPASELLPERFREWTAQLLAVLVSENAIPDVLQIGNEINWAGFNGDYPILAPGKGRKYGEASKWSDLPGPIREGARRCGEIAAIAKEVCRSVPGAGKQPAVILGSLNKPENLQWLRQIGGTFLAPEDFLAIVSGAMPGMPADERTNYLESLDGISLHFYPEIASGNVSHAERLSREYLEDFMEPVSRVTRLPVYITEFGFQRRTFDSESDRAAAFGAFVKAMRDTADKYRWKGLAIFSWDQMDHAISDPETGSVDADISRALGWKR